MAEADVGALCAEKGQEGTKWPIMPQQQQAAYQQPQPAQASSAAKRPDRSMVSAAGGLTAIGGAAQVEKLPAETGEPLSSSSCSSSISPVSRPSYIWPHVLFWGGRSFEPSIDHCPAIQAMGAYARLDMCFSVQSSLTLLCRFHSEAL